MVNTATYQQPVIDHGDGALSQIVGGVFPEVVRVIAASVTTTFQAGKTANKTFVGAFI